MYFYIKSILFQLHLARIGSFSSGNETRRKKLKVSVVIRCHLFTGFSVYFPMQHLFYCYHSLLSSSQKYIITKHVITSNILVFPGKLKHWFQKPFVPVHTADCQNDQWVAPLLPSYCPC